MNNWNKDEYGIVYYFEKRKLRSPPGYETMGNSKRLKLEEVNTSLVTLKQGSLLNMCYKYISQNIAILDSLIGLPEIIGKEMFMFMLDNNVFGLQQVIYEEEVSTKDKIKLRCLEVFSEAYETLVLKSLSFCYLPKPIPKMPLLLSSFSYLVELDLSGNSLDDGTLGIFSNMLRLKSLLLSDCQLSDATIQKFTLPYRMYPDRSKEMEILDLSNNINLTSCCLKCLQRFSSMKYLNVSNTSIKVDQLGSKFSNKNGWEVKKNGCVGDVYQKPVTEGWAKKIFEQIQQNSTKNKSAKSKKALSFYSGAKKKVKKKENEIVNILIMIREYKSDNNIHEDKNVINTNEENTGDLNHLLLKRSNTPDNIRTVFGTPRTAGARLGDLSDSEEDDILLQYQKNKTDFNEQQ